MLKNKYRTTTNLRKQLLDQSIDNSPGKFDFYCWSVDSLSNTSKHILRWKYPHLNKSQSHEQEGLILHIWSLNKEHLFLIRKLKQLWYDNTLRTWKLWHYQHLLLSTNFFFNLPIAGKHFVFYLILYTVKQAHQNIF